SASARRTRGFPRSPRRFRASERGPEVGFARAHVGIEVAMRALVVFTIFAVATAACGSDRNGRGYVVVVPRDGSTGGGGRGARGEGNEDGGVRDGEEPDPFDARGQWDAGEPWQPDAESFLDAEEPWQPDAETFPDASRPDTGRPDLGIPNPP